MSALVIHNTHELHQLKKALPLLSTFQLHTRMIANDSYIFYAKAHEIGRAHV